MPGDKGRAESDPGNRLRTGAEQSGCFAFRHGQPACLPGGNVFHEKRMLLRAGQPATLPQH